jgi:small-conductance mechanosensitive channel
MIALARPGGCRWRRWLFAVLLCLLALPFVVPETGAQETGGGDPAAIIERPQSPAMARDLVARLSDQEVRALLLEQLDAARAEPPAGSMNLGGMVQGLEVRTDLIRQHLVALAGAVDELPGVLPTAVERLRDGRPPSFFFWLTFGFVLMLAVGWAAERLFKRATGSARRAVLEAAPAGLGAKLGLLLARLGLDLLGLVVFLGAAVATFLVFYQGHEMTRTTVMTYVAVTGIVRLVSLLTRFLLAPDAPELRLDLMSDRDARFLHRATVFNAGIAAFGFFTCSLILMLGIGGAVHGLVLHLVSLVLTISLVATIWQARDGIRNNLLEGIPAGRARRLFADAWPFMVTVFIIGFFLLIKMIDFSGGGVSYLAGFGTLLTVIFLPPIDAMIERAASGGRIEGDDGGQVQAVVLRAVRIGLGVAALLFVAHIWDVDLHDMAAGGSGGRFADALIDTGLVMLVAYVLWETTRIAIDRRIAAERPAEAAEMGVEGGGGGSRLATLLPLLKRAIQITIGVMVVMLILSALGVNIGPLLAGAGVVGIAVGFGAQTLVRDIVSGIFFLVDDAFRVGEYVDVGAAKGTVEKISIRSFQLRHHRGALNTVPFGEIQTLTNYSRDWVVMKLEFRLPFDTDIALVKKLFKQIGRDLQEHPEIGADFIAPFKSQGVFSVDDSALIIRAKFTAKPGRQFLIKREAYSAVQKAFAENGIEFARKQVMVQIPDAGAMDPAERKRLEQAAASALAEDEPAPEGARA